MTGGVNTLMSSKSFSDARMSLLSFQNVRFRDNSWNLPWIFATWFLFMLCRFPLSRFNMHSHRNRRNSSWARLKEKIFAIVQNWLEHLETRKVLCVHRPKFLTVSAGPGCENLGEWNRCLYKNVFDCLCVATCQSANDRREQMLRLDTSQLPLICLNCALSVLTWITSRGDVKRTMRVFWC